MKFKKLLGLSLLSSPFVALFVFLGLNNGWAATLTIFGIAGVLMAVIWVGVGLLMGDL